MNQRRDKSRLARQSGTEFVGNKHQTDKKHKYSSYILVQLMYRSEVLVKD